MSLVGNLEDLGLGEILQIVSLSRKSGVLSLHSKGREGRVFFRNGQVTQATSSAYRQGLGEVLVKKGIIDLNQLKLALTIQEREAFRERLGSILIRCFGVPPNAIEEVVRDQIEKAVYSLFIWSDGTFDFDLQETSDAPDTIRMDPMQFMLNEGLNPQYLAMEGTRLIDEQRHRGEPDEMDRGPGEPGEANDDDIAFDLFLAGLRRTEVSLSAAGGTRPPVVVVDDDAAMREALGFLITKAGFEPFLYERSEDTLIRVDTLCRNGRSPTVIVDLIMPRMDGTGYLGGVELLELVRSNFPTLSIIALAEYRDPEFDRALCELGVPLILKPRRGEIADPGQLKRFNEQFLPLLLNPRYDTTTDSSTFNLGEEIRLELGEAETAPPELPAERGSLALLKEMLSELNNPTQGGGIILLVLRYAAEFMSRAIIFMVKKDEIAGLGQFGVKDTERSADSLVRSLRIPRDGETLFSQVIDRPFSQRIRPEENPGSRALCERLGGGVPSEMFLGPLVSEGKVVAILYGDNLTAGGPIGETEGLEIFLDQAGLAMEKALLQRRLREQMEVRA
jgi:CheY-like chemotaxis protein